MSDTVNRARATRILARYLKDTDVVVSNLGQASLDLQHAVDRPLNCYTYGAMGQCSSIAHGIALARPDNRVISLDGDGSMLMNLGSLATIATTAPKNLAVVIWDNEVHQTTGGQRTATSYRTSLAGVARGAGIDKVMEARTEDELRQAFDRIFSEDGPFFVNVKIEKGPAEGKLDREIMKYCRRFIGALGALPLQPAR